MLKIQNAQIYSSEKGFQAIVNGRYFRSVDFGKGPQFVRDSEPSPAAIQARTTGCKSHTFAGLRQINPALAESLEKAVKNA